MTDACFGGTLTDSVSNALFLFNFRVRVLISDKSVLCFLAFVVFKKSQSEAASRRTRDVTVCQCFSALHFKMPLWLRVFVCVTASIYIYL